MQPAQEPVFQCPRCQRAAGRQDKFTIHDRDSVKVIVRCGECRHRWSVIVDAAEYARFGSNRAG